MYGKVLNSLTAESRNFNEKLMKNVIFWKELLNCRLPFNATALCFPAIWYPYKIENSVQNDNKYFGGYTSMFDYCILIFLTNINYISTDFMEWSIIYLKNYFERILFSITKLERNCLGSSIESASVQEKGNNMEEANDDTNCEPLIPKQYEIYIEKFISSEKLLIDYKFRGDENNRYSYPEISPYLNNFGIFNKKVIFNLISILLNEKTELSDDQNIIDLVFILFKIEKYMDQMWLNNYWIKEGRFLVEVSKENIGINFEDFKEFFHIFFDFISKLKCKLCYTRMCGKEDSAASPSRITQTFSEIYQDILTNYPKECGNEFKQIVAQKSAEENLNFCHNIFSVCSEVEYTYSLNVGKKCFSIFEAFSETNKMVILEKFLLPLIENIIYLKKYQTKNNLLNLSFIFRFVIRVYNKVAVRMALQPLIEGLIPKTFDQSNIKTQEPEVPPPIVKKGNFNLSNFDSLRGVLKADILFKRIIKQFNKTPVKVDEVLPTLKEDHEELISTFNKFTPCIAGFKLTLEVVVCGSFPPPNIFKGFFQLPVDKIAMQVYLIELAHFLHQLNNGYIPLMIRLDTTPELSCQLALKLYRLKATKNLCALSNSIMEAMSDLVNYDKLQTHTALIFAALLVINETMVFLTQPLSITLTLKEKKIIEKSGATEELNTYFQNNVDNFLKNWQKITLKLIYNLFFNTKQRQFQDYMKISEKYLNDARLSCFVSYNKLITFYYHFSQNKSLILDLSFMDYSIGHQEIFIYLEENVGNLVNAPILLLARMISFSYGFINNLTLCIFWEMICNIDDSVSKSASVGFLVACEKWPKETNFFLNHIFKSKSTHDKFILVKNVENIFNARYFVYVVVSKSTLWMKLPSVEFGPSTPPIGVEFQAYRIEDSSWSESTFISTGLPRVISEDEENNSNINEEINIELLMSGNIKERTAFEEKSLLIRQKHLLFSSNLLLDAYLYYPYYNKRSTTKSFILASEIIEDGFIANVSSFLIFQCVMYLINSGIKSQYNLINSMGAQTVIRNIATNDPYALFSYIFTGSKSQISKKIAILPLLVKSLTQVSYHGAVFVLNLLFGYSYYICANNSMILPLEFSQIFYLINFMIPYVKMINFRNLKNTLFKNKCESNFLVTANIPVLKKIYAIYKKQQKIININPNHFIVDIFNCAKATFSNFEEESSLTTTFCDKKSNIVLCKEFEICTIYMQRSMDIPIIELKFNLNDTENYQKMNHHLNELFHGNLEKISFINRICTITKRESGNTLFFNEFKLCEKFPMNIIDINIKEIFNPNVCTSIYVIDYNRFAIWLKIISETLTSMDDFFGNSEEIKCFLDVINFSFILHHQNYAIVRLVLSIFVNISIQMLKPFAFHGFTYILPTIVRIYAKSSTIIKTAIEFAFFQFFDLHRKYLIYQTYSSIASSINSEIYNTNVNERLKIEGGYLCDLIFSLNKTPNDVLDITSLLIKKLPLSNLGFTDIEDLNLDDNVEYCIRLAILGIANDPKSYQSRTFIIILHQLLPRNIDRIKNDNNMELQKTQLLMRKYFTTLITSFEFLNENFTSFSAKAGSITNKDIKNNDNSKTAKISEPFCEPLVKRLREESEYTLQNRLLLPNIILYLVSKIYIFLPPNNDEEDTVDSLAFDTVVEQCFNLFLNILNSSTSSFYISEIKGLNYFISNMFEILKCEKPKHLILLEKTVDCLSLICQQILRHPNTVDVKIWKIIENLFRVLSKPIFKNPSLSIASNISCLVKGLHDIVCLSTYMTIKHSNLLTPEGFNQSSLNFICALFGTNNKGLNLSKIFSFTLNVNENKSYLMYEMFLAFLVIPILMKLENKTLSDYSAHLCFSDVEMLIRFLITLMKSILNFLSLAQNKQSTVKNLTSRVLIDVSLINKYLISTGFSQTISNLIFLALKIAITFHSEYFSRLWMELSVIIKEYSIMNFEDIYFLDFIKFALSTPSPLQIYLRYQLSPLLSKNETSLFENEFKVDGILCDDCFESRLICCADQKILFKNSLKNIQDQIFNNIK